jgi:hypothetical protein
MKKPLLFPYFQKIFSQKTGFLLIVFMLWIFTKSLAQSGTFDWTTACTTANCPTPFTDANGVVMTYSAVYGTGSGAAQNIYNTSPYQNIGITVGNSVDGWQTSSTAVTGTKALQLVHDYGANDPDATVGNLYKFTFNKTLQGVSFPIYDLTSFSVSCAQIISGNAIYNDMVEVTGLDANGNVVQATITELARGTYNNGTYDPIDNPSYLVGDQYTISGNTAFVYGGHVSTTGSTTSTTNAGVNAASMDINVSFSVPVKEIRILYKNQSGGNLGQRKATTTATCPANLSTLTTNDDLAVQGILVGSLAYTGIVLCNTGTTAPTLSATTKSNVCPATTADISSLVSSTCPVGSSLEWHNVSTGFSGSTIITASSVGAGTYYPVCHDVTNTCYSPAPATGVTVTINTCNTVSCMGTTIGSATIAPTTGAVANTYVVNSQFSIQSLSAGGGYTDASTGYRFGTPTATTDRNYKLIFSSPVTNVVLHLGFINNDIALNSPNPAGEETIANITAVGASGAVYTFQDFSTAGMQNLWNPTTRTISASVNSFGANSNSKLQISSTTPFTEITLTHDYITGTNPFGVLLEDVCYELACPAGTIAPTLSATAKSNVCPATTADISSLVSSTCPVGSSLEWHTVSTGFSAANKVATPASVAAGTYYPVCFDVTNTCYSPAPATGVTVTITTCCASGTTAPTLSATTKSNVCPSTTADISSLVSSSCPSGSSLEWHTVSTGFSAANKVANPTTVAAGTYYPVCHDATNTCYSPAPTTGVTVTITTCTSPLTISQPPAIIKPVNTSVTGSVPTDVIPTGGTGTITYSNGSTDPLCVAPSGANPLPGSSNLLINSVSGGYSYTTPTTAGTYYFCVKVCDSTPSTPICKIAIYKVTVTAPSCAVGTAIPTLK